MDADRPRTGEPRLGARDVVIASLAASAVIHVWLVPQHVEEPLLAVSFGAATVAAAALAYLVARGRKYAIRASAVLLAALLVAYPVVHVLTSEHVDALDVATKLAEALGLVGAVTVDGDDEAPLAAVDVLVGVFFATLLLSSLGHSHTA